MALPPWEILNALEGEAKQWTKDHPKAVGGNLYAEAAGVIREALLCLEEIKFTKSRVETKHLVKRFLLVYKPRKEGNNNAHNVEINPDGTGSAGN